MKKTSILLICFYFALYEFFQGKLDFNKCPSGTFLLSIRTSLPRPSMNNIRKNSTDQSGDNGMRAIASGYAMKARPGPIIS